MTMGKSEHIKIEALAVGYDGRVLIRDICADIAEGEIVTLIGPNGAGKSTILKSIAGHLAALGGKVIYDGEELFRMPGTEVAKKLSVVLTERFAAELMTCYDVVASGRYPYTGRFGILRERDEEIVDRAMERVHAKDLGTKDFNEISDGQRQRVLLARAICQEPEFIILDEPTSFLDVRYKLELLSILRSMANENSITVMMSLHEIDLAEKISDKIICVKGETLYGYGTPEEIFTEETIRDLFGIDNGFFDPLFGSTELPAPGNKNDNTEVFVISSGGSGIPIYRKLQKENIRFSAGILPEGDMDLRLARLLADEVVTEKAFSRFGKEALDKARSLIEKAERVILAPGYDTGEMNRGMEDLIALAEEQGKLERL